MRTISIINQKGGCGKTTSAINIAGLLARRGLRTLLVDLDPQSHCAAGLAIPEGRIDLDIGDVMLADDAAPFDATRLLWRASRNLDLAPSRMKLAGLEAARGGLADRPDKERRLASVLTRLAPNYDVCIVDCSPSIGLLTYNALAAATDILIPVETSFFALQGATKQINTIRSLAKRLETSAPYWLVATLHDDTSALARDLLDELRRRFGKRVSPHVIRRDLTLKEAASFGQPIIEYAPESHGAADYSALTDWLAAIAGLGSADGSVPAPETLPDEPPTIEVMATQSTGRRLPASQVEATPPPETVPVEFGPISPPPGHAAAVAARPLVGAKPVSQVAELASRLQGLSVPTSTPTEPAEPSRAVDLAQRARAMLLKRTDEQLKRLAGTPEPITTTPFTAPAPARGLHPTLRLIEEPKPGLESASPTRSESVRHLYGIRNTASGTLFVQPLSVGLRVAVAGDFTGWMPIPLRRNDQLGVHELCLPLPPGRRQYRLVIDGRWTADPFNDHSEPNPFGELNSIFTVETVRTTPVPAGTT